MCTGARSVVRMYFRRLGFFHHSSTEWIYRKPKQDRYNNYLKTTVTGGVRSTKKQRTELRWPRNNSTPGLAEPLDKKHARIQDFNILYFLLILTCISLGLLSSKVLCPAALELAELKVGSEALEQHKNSLVLIQTAHWQIRSCCFPYEFSGGSRYLGARLQP